MNHSLDTIKKFTLRVGKTIIRFSHNGVSVRPRYRLQLVDESRLATVWSFSGRRRRFVLWGAAIFLIITIGGAALLGVTPLRTLLPGYLRRDQRAEMTTMALTIDSLHRTADVNNLYLNNMFAILNDEIDTDSLTQAYEDSIAHLQLPVDSLLTASEAEIEFVRRHEQQGRFNVSVLSPVAAEGMVFTSPVSSIITSASDPSGKVTILPTHRQAVTSIYRGTVIDTHFTPGEGYTVLVQHPNDFISRLSGLESIMVSQGERVNTGSALGMTASPDDASNPISLEMWYNGSSLDPKSYITYLK